MKRKNFLRDNKIITITFVGFCSHYDQKSESKKHLHCSGSNATQQCIAVFSLLYTRGQKCGQSRFSMNCYLVTVPNKKSFYCLTRKFPASPCNDSWGRRNFPILWNFLCPRRWAYEGQFQNLGLNKIYFYLVPESKTILHGPICGGKKNSTKQESCAFPKSLCMGKMRALQSNSKKFFYQ